MKRQSDRDYKETLLTQDRERYNAKISVINGVDLYALTKEALSTDYAALPQIQYYHVYHYLVLARSFNTCEQFRAWKYVHEYTRYENK